MIQSKGAQTDPFSHSLAGFSGITTLAIGYSPFAPGYASLGAYAPGDFYLCSITLAPVREPGSAWLTAAGLLGVIAAIRKRG